MTKINEFAFVEMVNHEHGFLIIRFDTMDDFSHKVDMIETDQYAEVRKRMVESVQKLAMLGMDKVSQPAQGQLPVQGGQPTAPQQPQTTPAQPPAQPVQPPTVQGQGQGYSPSQNNIEGTASKFPTVEAYLLSIDFKLSDKKHPHVVSYFRTEKSGKKNIAYLNVFQRKGDNMWGMAKWLIDEHREEVYNPSWGAFYSEIIEVVDAIHNRILIYGQ